MEHTNWFFPVQPDRNERPPNMDPRAWLLKVVIEEIELKQKDFFPYVRSVISLDSLESFGFLVLRFELNSSSGDGFGLAFESSMFDAWALSEVMGRVQKNDNLREVLTRALRSIRQRIRLDDDCWLSFRRVLNGLVPSAPGSKQEYVDASDSDSELAKVAYALHAFLSSVLHLLTSVFQYLLGYVDRGGSKTYSSGAFDFRASFVSLLLFQGAYVWIKFRQAARPDCRKRKAPDVQHEVVDIEGCELKGIRKRSIKNSTGAFIRFKYEPRFKPPRQQVDDGKRQLNLGEYHTPAEAQIVLQIARHHYDKDGGCVELKYGQCKFLIPPMSEQERGLAGKEKRTWVTCTAKQVGKQMYADFQREKGKQLAMAAEAGSDGAESNDPSSSALPLPCPSPPMLTTMAAEPAIASAAPSPPSPPLLPLDGAIEGGADFPSEALSSFKDMIVELFCDLELPNPPDQQLNVISSQMQYQGFAQLLGDPSLPGVGAVPGGIEHDSERELHPSPSFQQGRVLADAGTENTDGRIFLQQSDPVLQRVVFCQRCLGDNARQFVPLDQLQAYQVQNLRLQQENESLKRKLQQVARSQVAT